MKSLKILKSDQVKGLNWLTYYGFNLIIISIIILS